VHSWSRGFIFNWEGAIVDIPEGFGLCDGSNGTPDLRDRFVVGAGSTYSVDETGGLLSHPHRFRGDSHVHGIGSGPNLSTDVLPFDDQMAPGVAQGDFDSSNHLSPYYALAYIMFL